MTTVLADGLDVLSQSETAVGAPDSDAPNGAVAKPLLTLAQRDRLARVLDRGLGLLAIAQLLEPTEPTQALATELGLRVENGLIALRMKVATDAAGAIDPALLEAFKALGLTITGEDLKRGLVIARVPVASLMKLALLEQVKRVEPMAPR